MDGTNAHSCALEDLPDGITVVYGPNEVGKSSLLRALNYGLYQRHKLGGEEAEADILPAGTSLAPQVEIEFEHDGTRWKIRKTFLKRREASLERWDGSKFVPQHDGDEADEELAKLLQAGFAGKGKSKPEHRGIGEVLIAEHANLRDVHTLGERARSSLHGILGAVATTVEAHGLALLVYKRNEELFTASGELRANAPPERLTVRLAEIDQQLVPVRSELEQARNLESRLESSEEAESDAEARRAALRIDVLRAREDADKRVALVSKHAQSVERRDATRKDLDRLENAEGRLKSLRADLTGINTKVTELEVELQESAHTLQAIEERRRTSSGDLQAQLNKQGEVDAENALADDADRAVACAKQIEDLGRRVDEYGRARTERERLSKMLLEVSRPDGDELRAMQRAQREIDKVRAKLDAFNVRVKLRAIQDLTVVQPEGKLELGARKSTEIGGRSPLKIKLPGIAELEIHGPVSEAEASLRSDLEQLGSELRNLSERFGTLDLGKLESLAAERAGFERGRDVVDGKVSGNFKSVAAFEKAGGELTQAATEFESILARRKDWRSEAPTRALAQHLRDGAKRGAKLHGEALAKRRELLEGVEEDSKRATSALNRAKERLHESQTKKADLHATVQELTQGLGDSERSRQIERLQSAVKSLDAECASLASALAPLEHAASSLDAAERALGAFETQRDQRLRERSDAQARLDVLREKGLYSRLASLEETRSATSEELDRETRRAHAIRHLTQAFEEEHRRSVEALIKPIADKVRRMGQAVLRKDVRLELDDNLSTGSVGLGERRFARDHLSDGTQDQIAMFTRIALAELYAEKYGPCALVLDDPLARSDPERRARMLDVLARAARKLQILIFTCREDDYLRLDAPRIRLDLSA